MRSGRDFRPGPARPAFKPATLSRRAAHPFFSVLENPNSLRQHKERRAARRGLPQRPRPSLPAGGRGGGDRSSQPAPSAPRDHARPPPARYLRRQRRSRACRRRRSSPAPLPCRASRRGALSPAQAPRGPRRSPAMAAAPVAPRSRRWDGVKGVRGRPDAA